MKNDYLNELKEILENHGVTQSDIQDIMSDYNQMYDDGLDKQMSDDEIRELLGEPSHIYNDLKDTLSFIREKSKKHKFVALSPFIALIIFMSIGLTTQIWHPTWLIFMLIPISGVLSGKGRDTFIGLTPFIALISFFLISYYIGHYEFAWLVFLLTPITAAILHPKIRNIMFLLSLLLGIGFYLYMGIVRNQFQLGLLGFILPLMVAIINKQISIKWSFAKNEIMISGAVMFWIIAFLLMGLFLPNAWGYAWQVLLLIPISAIVLSGRFKWVTIMPFLATIIFFSTGYFFGLFYISWLAFLLIPITGILETQK